MRSRITHRLTTLAAAAALAAAPASAQEAAPATNQAPAPAPAPAASAAPPAPDLEARLTALEKKLAEPPKPSGPEVKLGGLVQADGRFYQDDPARKLTDDLLLRRVRLDTQAKLGAGLSARVQVDLAGSALQTLDAYADVRWIPGLLVRAGKFTPPVGIERLVATPALLFVEYAQTSNLVPNRDLGLQAEAQLGGLGSASVGLFDGTADAGQNERDSSDDKDVVARLALRPVDGLTVHLAGSHGTRAGDATATFLPSYKADSQGATWFKYATGAFASGQHTRWTAAGSYYLAGLGLLGEYVASRQRVVKVDAAGAVTASVRPTNSAWQVAASYVLTGEKNGEGIVKPASPVDAGGLGALRVKARYQQASVDGDVFTGGTFASAASASRKATGFNAGLDWFATSAFRLELEWSQTSFDGGAAAGADRPTEKAILSRVQVAF